MDQTDFWKLIDTSKRKSDGDVSAQMEVLRHHLVSLPATEICHFGKILDEFMAESYSWDLWAAAYIINGGCSDDGFHYFRGWLIAQGRKIFEAALNDPEILVEVASSDECECEQMTCMARVAYETKTGKDIPDNGVCEAAEPAGEPWEEDSKALRKKYPRLWSKSAG